MIHASKAREIVEASQATLDKILDSIEKDIIETATAGKKEMAIYKDGLWSSATSAPPTTPMQERVITALRNYGYSAALQAHGNPYIPRAMDHDDDAPWYSNYCIVVKW